MKNVNDFKDFLDNKVNLNQSRIDKLNQKVDTITTLLKTKLNGYRKYNLQGSYAHKTIIKPVKSNNEFDADILIFIKDNNFNPHNFNVDYVKQIHNVFKNDGNYNDKIKLNTRCLTIDYVGDFHLDIVPCIEHNNIHYICNRRDSTYEQTDGNGYKKWLADKNSIVGGHNFRKVTRLFKFLRDHKSNFSVKSILLTTLLGNQVNNQDDYPDLPTTLKDLSNKVNSFLQENYYAPIITNPLLPNENFNRHCDDKKYLHFREMFNIYNTKINAAFNTINHNESVKKWRELFGDYFGELKNDSTSKTAGGAGLLSGVSATTPYAGNDFIQP